MTRAALILVSGMTLTVAACASSPDTTEPTNGSGPRAFAAPVALLLGDLDLDRDAVVQREEVGEGARRLFTAADADQSGALERPELVDFLVARLGSEYPSPGRIAFDADGDGATPFADFEAVLISACERFDANQDGALTRAELVREFTPGARPGGRGGREGQRRRRRG